VPITAVLRHCDFSKAGFAPQVPLTTQGGGTSVIRIAGSSVSAEVHMSIAGQPNTHYDVGLIQAPRPSSATCGPGDPGTVFTGLDTDAGGQATVTLQDSLRQGTTGVWVSVERPSPHSQTPAEFYTSEIVAPV
jgi:hypothetical protein